MTLADNGGALRASQLIDPDPSACGKLIQIVTLDRQG